MLKKLIIGVCEKVEVVIQGINGLFIKKRVAKLPKIHGKKMEKLSELERTDGD